MCAYKHLFSVKSNSSAKGTLSTPGSWMFLLLQYFAVLVQCIPKGETFKLFNDYIIDICGYKMIDWLLLREMVHFNLFEIFLPS